MATAVVCDRYLAWPGLGSRFGLGWAYAAAAAGKDVPVAKTLPGLPSVGHNTTTAGSSSPSLPSATAVAALAELPQQLAAPGHPQTAATAVAVTSTTPLIPCPNLRPQELHLCLLLLT